MKSDFNYFRCVTPSDVRPFSASLFQWAHYLHTVPPTISLFFFSQVAVENGELLVPKTLLARSRLCGGGGGLGFRLRADLVDPHVYALSK